MFKVILDNCEECIKRNKCIEEGTLLHGVDGRCTYYKKTVKYKIIYFFKKLKHNYFPNRQQKVKKGTLESALKDIKAGKYED